MMINYIQYIIIKELEDYIDKFIYNIDKFQNYGNGLNQRSIKIRIRI